MSSPAASLPTHATDPNPQDAFAYLDLHEDVLQSIRRSGYPQPTPVQHQTIPFIRAGRDVLAQAVTGSGKTAAFSWPILSMLDTNIHKPQALILAPTRELATQTKDAIAHYGANLPGFRVASVYGGQSYEPQLRDLRRGAHVVVGTPGRIIDHIRRHSLHLGALRWLVIDEADEMLRMGFLEDIEWIISQTPTTRQSLLFSATLPKPIRRIANQYLNNPQQITVESREMTAATIEQRYVVTKQSDKLETLTRIIEVTPTDGVLVFVRTRSQTADVASELLKAGHRVGALSGDMPQAIRERTVQRLREGSLDVVVATDVAARGLDVERISHVVNFDFPNDVETYIHRIGRTGRAGRSGEAILFVTPRERRLLGRIESGTRQRIAAMDKPSLKTINRLRTEKFKESVVQAAGEDSPALEHLVEEICRETGLEMIQVAAALAKLAQGTLRPESAPATTANSEQRKRPAAATEKPGERTTRGRNQESGAGARRRDAMQTYRVSVGRIHKVSPKELVDAIAYESDLPAGRIGNIRIQHDTTTIDLPGTLPAGFFNDMEKVELGGQQLVFELDTSAPRAPATDRKNRGRRKESASTKAEKRKAKSKGRVKTKKNRVRKKT